MVLNLSQNEKDKSLYKRLSEREENWDAFLRIYELTILEARA